MPTERPLGAREKAARARAERNAELRHRFADEVGSGQLAGLIDAKAVGFVRRHGWADRQPSAWIARRGSL